MLKELNLKQRPTSKLSHTNSQLSNSRNSNNKIKTYLIDGEFTTQGEHTLKTSPLKHFNNVKNLNLKNKEKQSLLKNKSVEFSHNERTNDTSSLNNINAYKNKNITTLNNKNNYNQKNNPNNNISNNNELEKSLNRSKSLNKSIVNNKSYDNFNDNGKIINSISYY